MAEVTHQRLREVLRLIQPDASLLRDAPPACGILARHDRIGYRLGLVDTD